MTLRNPNAQLVDFTALNGVIESNPKFAPSDIDMIYERNGFYLVAEWKKPDEALVKNSGQDFLLQTLAKNERFTVLIIVGYSQGRDMVIQKIDRITRAGLVQNLHATGDGVPRLREIIQKWYKAVDDVQK